MVFSSTLFLYCFLPIFLLSYHIIGNKYKNYVLLAFSLIFYAWGAPKFISLLLGSLIVNFFLVSGIEKSESRKKLLLVLSLGINISLLGYFKYINFFVDNVNRLLCSLNIDTVSWVEVALPIGISFFTFQSITYTIDVYRGIHKPLNRLSDYLLYILMFPQLIAGPIVRFNTIADDIVDRKQNDTIDNKLYGVILFVIGLSKKVLIANVMGAYVDTQFGDTLLGDDTVKVWLTMLAYTFQIYFDFSGYSDMAIGLGKIIGFNFPENFNNPYISQSITEFWRRWHMTLGSWMKEYLYIPLGGNRVKSTRRLYANLIVVFLVSGLWHGANWTFVAWGAWHGLFLVLDRIFLEKYLKHLGTYVRVFLCFITVVVGWVFFRSESLDQAFSIIGRMFSYHSNNALRLEPEFITVLIIAIVCAFSGLSKIGKTVQSKFYREDKTLREYIIAMVFAIILFLICSAFINASGFNPFIYFRF